MFEESLRMKRLAGLSVLALMISSTSGCGWLWGEDGYFRDRGNDYLDARETAPMQLPAGGQAKRPAPPPPPSTPPPPSLPPIIPPPPHTPPTVPPTISHTVPPATL